MSYKGGEKQKISLAYSWPVVIILIILFWPIGLYLLWKRVTVDKQSSLNSGKIVLNFGYAFILISIMGIIVSISEGFGKDDIGTIIFFVLAGVSMILLGLNMKNTAKKYKKYISIIVNGGTSLIDKIAEASDINYDEVRADIDKMLEKGYFTGAYIDESTNEIILAENKNKIEKKTSIVTCRGCGANNTIVVGESSGCEFCGSPIS